MEKNYNKTLIVTVSWLCDYRQFIFLFIFNNLIYFYVGKFKTNQQDFLSNT